VFPFRRGSAPAPCVAAAALRSSRTVLAFDRRGHVVKELSGPYDAVRDRVSRELSTVGSLFWIDAKVDIQIQPYDPDSGGGGLGTTCFEWTVDATKCTPATWLAEGREGQPAGRATWVLTERERFAFAPADIWLVIRDAALDRPPAS